MLIGVALEDRVEKIEISEREILEFPWGIIGFDNFKSFAIFRLDDPLFLLQSTDNPFTGFVVIDPELIDPSYCVDLATEERTLLQVEDEDQQMCLAIVTLDLNGVPSTVNMRAPIVINISKRIGVQAVLQDARYPVRCPMPFFEKTGEARNDMEEQGREKKRRRSNGGCSSDRRMRRC